MTVILAFVIIPTMFLWAWALRLLWAWFIIPLFPAAPVLSFAQAMGLSLTVSMFKSGDAKKTEDGEMGRAIAQMFLRPIMSVGIGWLVKYFGGL